jgi:hypothetical protein
MDLHHFELLDSDTDPSVKTARLISKCKAKKFNNLNNVLLNIFCLEEHIRPQCL